MSISEDLYKKINQMQKEVATELIQIETVITDQDSNANTRKGEIIVIIYYDLIEQISLMRKVLALYTILRIVNYTNIRFNVVNNNVILKFSHGT